MDLTIAIEEQGPDSLVGDHVAWRGPVHGDLTEKRIGGVEVVVVAVGLGPGAAVEQSEALTLGEEEVPTISGRVHPEEALCLLLAQHLERGAVEHGDTAVVGDRKPGTGASRFMGLAVRRFDVGLRHLRGFSGLGRRALCGIGVGAGGPVGAGSQRQHGDREERRQGERGPGPRGQCE